jgi:hypothetical protein
MNTEFSEQEFIAERQWEYRISPTESIPIRVAFTRPKQGVRGTLWEAKFLIFWINGKTIERKTYGTDSVDALIMIVALFHIECRKISDEMNGSITYDSHPLLFGYEQWPGRNRST